jgi:triacylglycerol esterase/lipase EstA (alpha/beta hydrolase family)
VKLRAAAFLLALLVAGSVAGPADARRSDNRKKPVLFVHGFELDGTHDCASWRPMKRKFRRWGHTGKFWTIAYYRGDTNCTHWLGHHGRHSRHHGHRGRAHGRDTNLRHLGYHLAWTIWNHYSKRGKRVDVVAHSMGGLIIRYALAQTQRDHKRFPPYLLVEDVVTMGTPHGGARWFTIFCSFKQCQQMRMGSNFLVWLERKRNGWNPQGRGGTDWSTFGSTDDNIVPADRAAGTARDRSPIHDYIGSCHKVWYRGAANIGHSDFKTRTSKRITAPVYRFNCQGGGWRKDNSSHWPVRRADLAITFKNR